MDEFLAVAFAYPTLVWTVSLVVAMVYWLAVIVGALDVDALGGAAGKVDGLLDGAAEGAVEAAAGKAEGALDALAGKAEAAAAAAAGKAEGVAEDALDGDGPLASILSALSLRNAPVTVTLSLIFLFSWIGSFYGARYAMPLVPGPEWVGGTLVLLAALVASLPLTSLVTRPLRPIFQQEGATKHKDLIGKTVVVQTSRVDGKFGEAELSDHGSALLLQVRCESENDLKKGGEALIVGWDPEREAFDVEPLDDVMGRRGK